MRERLELEQLIEAEQELEPPAGCAEQGWQRLSETLASGAPAPMPVPVDGPLALKAAGLASKPVAILAIVGAAAVGAGGWIAASALGTDTQPERAAELEQGASPAERPAAVPPEATLDSAETDEAPQPATPNRDRSAQSSSRVSSGAAKPAGASALGSSSSPADDGRGFDEELAARTRLPLESIRTRANQSGTFRSGRAVQEEQRVVAQEAGALLTARQRLQLQGASGLAGAARNLSDVSLAGLGAESELEAGLADYYQGRENQRSTGMMDAFQLFLQAQGSS